MLLERLTLAATEWKTVQQVSLLSPSSACGTLLQLSGKLLSDAVKATQFEVFIRSALPEIASELSVQWIGLAQRVPGPNWEVVAEHGPQGMATKSVALWDGALERDAAGVYRAEQNRIYGAFPLTAGTPFAHLLVTAGRHADEDLADSGLLLARTLSMALSLLDHELQSRRQVERLRSTLDIASRLSMAEDAAPLLELIAHEATRLLNCDRSSIFLWDRERGEVEARPALGVKGASLRIPAGEGIVGETLRTGKAICVDDAYEDSRFNQEVDRKSGYRTRNLICVPLRDAQGQLVGAFEGINSNDNRPFSEDDVECLTQLGTQAAVALRNLQERDLLHRSHSQLAERVTKGVMIIGESMAISALRDTIKRLASTDLPVLVLGESGTGKEVVAQSLHYEGNRANCPFVAVNCAALTESLLESELFGHERGAFTDARDMRQGKFELANGGTLFLDEIGDMSPGGQAKLLRVLEQKVITRVGGSQTIPINVRIIAATNANLAEAVRARKFREDLYYRLGVVTLDLPPLRERPEDILPLAEFFLKRFATQARRPQLQLSSEARRRLQSHTWPGNVRELRNLMERIAFLCPGDRVEVDDLAFILSPDGDSGRLPALELGLENATREFQRDFIRRSVRQVNDNMTDAARLLGLHRSNLYRKMKQLEMKEVGGTE
ncbi:MAG: sigma-54-dependent Fis family transcriptional regulator [Planctomycetaceae bacterium]|nr:sigma-54-dependent Fis family transcriptional regulator [Planctomycetaceae bacterium]